MFRLRRREFITLIGGAAVAAFVARAQQRKRLRVGFVGMQPRAAPHYANFLKRMAEFGYLSGFTGLYKRWYDLGRTSHSGALASALIRRAA